MSEIELELERLLQSVSLEPGLMPLGQGRKSSVFVEQPHPSAVLSKELQVYDFIPEPMDAFLQKPKPVVLEQKRMRLLKLFMLMSVALLSACSSITTDFHADAHINPDIQGAPSPLALSIFELTDAQKFQTASFFNLYGNAAQTLATTLLYQKDLVVSPGQQLVVTLPYVEGVHFVGYVAAFRNGSVCWRRVVRVQPWLIMVPSIHIFIDAQGLHVASEVQQS
jgi:type VI secretion system protein VasD